MKYQILKKQGIAYLDCFPFEGLLSSENDALDLVAACAENETERLMLHAGNLPDDFYNLRTGLAGAVLLKFTNYHIRVAAVIAPELSSQGRFGEMVLETNRGDQFRVFPDRESAERWLVAA